MNDSIVASDTGTTLTCRGCRFCRPSGVVPDSVAKLCLLCMKKNSNRGTSVTWFYDYGTSPGWCPLKGGDQDCRKQHS